jgi:phosphoribosylamine-glycine ligase
VVTSLKEVGIDIYELFDQAAHGVPDGERLRYTSGTTVLTVCLARPGYPAASSEDVVITGLETVCGNVIVLHGCTKRSDNGEIVQMGAGYCMLLERGMILVRLARLHIVPLAKRNYDFKVLSIVRISVVKRCETHR